MWGDFVAAFTAAPVWAQVAMVVFAILSVMVLTAPARQRREFGGKFEQLARGAGAPTSRGRTPWPESFTVTIDGRVIEVVHDYRSRGGGGSVRGPSGHVLMFRTPLRSPRWEVHGIEIQPGVPGWLRSGAVSSGDAAFDARFYVRQDGVPVREGWLDPLTADAITAVYNVAHADGPTWVSAQQLVHVVPPPWEYVAATTLRQQLRALAGLASALERTAGYRVPPA
jgi:hypothetical protein